MRRESLTQLWRMNVVVKWQVQFVGMRDGCFVVVHVQCLHLRLLLHLLNLACDVWSKALRAELRMSWQLDLLLVAHELVPSLNIWNRRGYCWFQRHLILHLAHNLLLQKLWLVETLVVQVLSHCLRMPTDSRNLKFLAIVTCVAQTLYLLVRLANLKASF